MSRISSGEIEYKAIGDIVEGDVILSSHGEGTEVTHAYDHHMPESMYRLRFANGEVFNASGNHLWYTVTSLDKQMHKNRIRRAKTFSQNLDGKKMAWLYRSAEELDENSPEVDLAFFIEILNAKDEESLWQIKRICESIGPVAMQKPKLIDADAAEIIAEMDNTQDKPLYSMKIFAQQMLALLSEALKLGDDRYELLKGKVRTTEEIAHTYDMKHDFPSVRTK